MSTLLVGKFTIKYLNLFYSLQEMIYKSSIIIGWLNEFRKQNMKETIKNVDVQSTVKSIYLAQTLLKILYLHKLKSKQNLKKKINIQSIWQNKTCICWGICICNDCVIIISKTTSNKIIYNFYKNVMKTSVIR